ncbi:MAG: hypothetical protein OXL68_14275 [Paracoccaceae bacterium]|nr:hypothetical protein [Paracoccaceae bacterium]
MSSWRLRPRIVEEPDPPAIDRDITVVLDDRPRDIAGNLHESLGSRHDFSHAGRMGIFARALFSQDSIRHAACRARNPGNLPLASDRPHPGHGRAVLGVAQDP